MIEALKDPSDMLRSVAVGGLSEVAVKHLDPLRTATDDFVALLNEETESLRGHTWIGLDDIGTTDDLDRLHEHRDGEPSPEDAGTPEDAI